MNELAQGGYFAFQLFLGLHKYSFLNKARTNIRYTVAPWLHVWKTIHAVRSKPLRTLCLVNRLSIAESLWRWGYQGCSFTPNLITLVILLFILTVRNVYLYMDPPTSWFIAATIAESAGFLRFATLRRRPVDMYCHELHKLYSRNVFPSHLKCYFLARNLPDTVDVLMQLLCVTCNCFLGVSLWVRHSRGVTILFPYNVTGNSGQRMSAESMSRTKIKEDNTTSMWVMRHFASVRHIRQLYVLL